MLKKREYTGNMMSKENGSLCMVGFSVDFIPTTLNNQEVYEVKKENDHYCYMTPGMVDKIFELIPGNKDSRYVDQFSFDLDNKTSNFVKLKNKLLLDLPDNVDANSFGSMRFSFVQYTEDVKKEPVVLKVQRQYRLDVIGELNVLGEDSGAIELILPDNKLECNNFQIYSQKKIDQILEINTKNSKMDAVFIDNLAPNDIGPKEVHLSVDFEEEGGILFVQYGSIPTFSCKNGYINFKTGKTFHLNNATIKTVFATKNLSNVHFSSHKDIEIENSDVSLHHSAVRLSKDQNIGIKGNGSINICDSICEIHDFVSNDGGLYVSQKGKRGAMKRDENKIQIVESSFFSPTYLSSAKGRSLLVKESLVDNGAGKVTIDGGRLVLSSKILGNKNQPMTISNSSIRLSEIIDTNEIKWAYIFNTKLENCLIENHKDNKKANIFMGPQINSAMSHVLNGEDRETKWVLKNCQIKVDKGYLFRAVGFEGGKFIAENSTFNRGFTFIFYIDEDKKEEIKDFTFNIKNSLINRSSFSLAKGPYGNFSTTSVINSEINDAVIFSGLELLKDSIANYNTQLSGYSKVDSCFFDGGITKDAKDGEHELIGYNGAASTFVDEPKKDVGKANNELEIL